MQNNFSPDKLSKWITNFTDNEQVPFITKSALISLKDLEDFITTIKSQHADSIRIYFVRFQPNDIPTQEVLVNDWPAEGCKWRDAENGFTQASVAIVPANNFKRDENFIFSADDIIIKNEITTLMPGIEKEGTGLNPPRPVKPEQSLISVTIDSN